MLDFFNKSRTLDAEAVMKKKALFMTTGTSGKGREGKTEGWETGFVPKHEKATLKDIIG